MKNRKNYLKARKKQLKWFQLGWVVKDSICPICGEKPLIQFDRYDSWGCISCNEWLDEACDDLNCPYCSIRPKTPYEAYFIIDTEIGSAGLRKRWRCDNYQHKTNGMKKHMRRRLLAEQRQALCLSSKY